MQADGLPRISVIVPVFSASAWIERCIHGLLKQDYDASRFEIILVDHNSSDDSNGLLRRCQRVRLLEESVQSSYAARNRGVRESSGELLAFTDADCVPSPNWLQVIASAMRNERTQAVLGSRTPGRTSGPLRLIAAYKDARVRYIIENRRKRSYFAFTSKMAIRRSVLDRYGPFETVARGADTLFLLRLATCTGPEAAEWMAQMRVQHLEFQSAWAYFKKSFLYAQAQKRTKTPGTWVRLRNPCGNPDSAEVR